MTRPRLAVALRALKDRRRALLWWALGLLGLIAMHAGIYPSLHSDKSLVDLTAKYPQALKNVIAFGGSTDYTTGAGYLGAEVFSLMLPLLLIVAAVGSGARALAGEEDQGTLDLLLANPLSRTRLVVEKALALVVEIGFLGLVVFLALAVASPLAGMGVATLHLLAATVDAVLLSLLFGLLALAVGALAPGRGRAIGLAGGLAVGSYLVATILPLVGSLKGLRVLSPFYHYAAQDPLRHGLAFGHTALLVALGLASLALAVWGFARRDLR